MPSIRSLCLVLLVAAGSCSAARMTAPVPTGDLQAAPVSVIVSRQTLVLVPSLWRDFMPISPADGKPLVAVLRVQATDGAALAATFHVDGAWVINGAEVWTASVGEETLASPSRVYYEVVARDGPIACGNRAIESTCADYWPGVTMFEARRSCENDPRRVAADRPRRGTRRGLGGQTHAVRPTICDESGGGGNRTRVRSRTG